MGGWPISKESLSRVHVMLVIQAVSTGPEPNRITVFSRISEQQQVGSVGVSTFFENALKAQLRSSVCAETAATGAHHAGYTGRFGQAWRAA